MSRHRAQSIYTLFIGLSLYLTLLICSRFYTTVFIAFLTLGWHILANVYCAWISSYRFKNPIAKYIEIKNKFIRKIFVRRFSVGKVPSTSKHDNRTNIIGLVLNIINTLLFVSFEILLFMPKISCDPYVFTVTVGTRPRNYTHLEFELDSLNEVIPAEVSRAFFLAMSLVFMVFVVLFERQIKEHRRKLERTKKTESPYKPFKKTEWYYPLYTSLVDISLRRNNKKHRFWYDAAQLNEIEDLVYSATENAELKLERKGNKLASFNVIDTLNDHVMFTGSFI